MALFHGPMKNKNSQSIVTSITNIDIHDIARSGFTYGIAEYFLVHPLSVQRQIASRILGHWSENSQKDYNLDRSDAFRIVKLAHDFQELKNLHPNFKFIATSARETTISTKFSDLRGRIKEGENIFLGLGTGHGMTDEFIQQMDEILEPIQGPSPYNHLSVRSAAAVIFDRLLGQ